MISCRYLNPKSKSKFSGGDPSHVLAGISTCFLSKSNIQDHHQGEAYCEEDGSDIGMFSGGHFGDEFFYYYVEHGSGGEA